MKKDLVSINDFNKEEILHILDMAKKFEANPDQNLLNGKAVSYTHLTLPTIYSV